MNAFLSGKEDLLTPDVTTVTLISDFDHLASVEGEDDDGRG
jgi:hypothetical protein